MLNKVFLITTLSITGGRVFLGSNEVLKTFTSEEQADEFVSRPENRGTPMIVIPALEMPFSRQIHYLTINSPKMNKEDIALVLHAVINAYNQALGDNAGQLLSWDQAPEWVKQTTREAVQYHIDNPDATPPEIHKAWLTAKANDHWGYGPMIDETRKHHPNFVEYDKLPVEQRAKDYITRQLIHSLKPFLQAVPAPMIGTSSEQLVIPQNTPSFLQESPTALTSPNAATANAPSIQGSQVEGNNTGTHAINTGQQGVADDQASKWDTQK